jgi:hypothetical protein
MWRKWGNEGVFSDHGRRLLAGMQVGDDDSLGSADRKLVGCGPKSGVSTSLWFFPIRNDVQGRCFGVLEGREIHVKRRSSMGGW